MAKATLKTCNKGHTYHKSSDCPSCPVCEQANKPSEGFMVHLAAPARRALINANILSIETLASYSETEILQLHGMGPSSLPKLKKVLQQHQLTFKNS